ncbi:VTT domain-containing protein [Nocardioides sp. W7]|uniref:DedA family protein n=1 Tax=Nocardioides sp. W7 TaxID=2931390 RepID=UPI001FD3F60D|nr:VTT domain-containing protein [Nocardioides sp. W7]
MNDLWAQYLDLLQALTSPVDDAADWFRQFGPGERMAIAGVAAALETSLLIGILVPGDLVLLLAGTAVASPGEGVGLAVAVSVGAVVGDLGGYALGRWLGPRWRARRLSKGRHGRVENALDYLEHRGGPAILLARFLPFLRSIMPFAVGLSGRSPSAFLVWAVPAAVLWSALYVPIYALAGAPLRDGSAAGTVSLAFSAVGLVVFAGCTLAQRRVQRRLRGASPAA